MVVVSAMSGETNRLIALAEKIDPDYRGSAYDMLIASGEQVSISLLAIALQKRGIKAQPLLAYQLGIRTDSTFAKARIQSIDTDPIFHIVAAGAVPVVAGFQGVDEDDNITTLGRGGSDTTAVALAAAIQGRAKCDCEIYTDVPAVFTADPRLVDKAREIPTLSCEEMMEMAALGSKVLHIRCVEIAAKYHVKVHLRSTFEEREGTWILPETIPDTVPEKKADTLPTPYNQAASQLSGKMNGPVIEQLSDEGPSKMNIQIEQPVVSAVTHDANTAVFKLYPVPSGPDFLAKLFETLAKKGVVVDIITQSETSDGQRLAFSVTKEDIPLSRQALKDFVDQAEQVTLIENMAKLSVVGVGMRNHPGVAARFFSVLAKTGVPIHLVTTSEIKISAVIDQAKLKAAAQAMHTEFGLDAIGTGV